MFSDQHSSAVAQLTESLLHDFEFWFGFAASLPEVHNHSNVSSMQQISLSIKVKQAWREVKAAQALLQASRQPTGVELSLIMQWYHLLFEIWLIIDDTPTYSCKSPHFSSASLPSTEKMTHILPYVFQQGFINF